MLEVASVAEAGEVVDVLVAHLERALEDQGLEHSRVKPTVRLSVVAQRGVSYRGVLQRQHERLAEVGVDVPDLDRAAGRGRECPQIAERLNLEIPPQRIGKRFVLIRA
jgi:hypothetical protein